MGPQIARSKPNRALSSGTNLKPTFRNHGRLFFPQSQALGLSVDETLSPAVMQKTVHLASKLSFDSAAQTAAATLELKLTTKRVERLTERIGCERVAQREQSIAQWQKLPLVEKLAAPPGIKAPAVVVISPDGGRLQRCDLPDTAKSHWCEDKVGALMELQPNPHDCDPSPQIPDKFLDVVAMDEVTCEIKFRVPKGTPFAKSASATERVATAVLELVPTAAVLESVPPAVSELIPAVASEIVSTAAVLEPVSPAGSEPVADAVWEMIAAAAVLEPVSPAGSELVAAAVSELVPTATLEMVSAAVTEPVRTAVSQVIAAAKTVVAKTVVASGDVVAEARAAVVMKPPVIESRDVVASLEDSEQFGKHLAAHAWSLGFAAALLKAFIADGSSTNWGIWQREFKHQGYVPILDFIHALTYVFAAAMAGRSRAEGGPIYQRWITWVWQGHVQKVIAEIAARAAELGPLPPHASETDPRQIVADTLTYLTNQQSRMNYPSYRQFGLPITSSPIESTVKQMNQRVKGSEKFWSESGGEALLQLRADQLCDTDPLALFWIQRAREATGTRAHRRQPAA